MADINEILGQVRLPEKTVPLCLRADLQSEWEDLERQLRQAQQKPGNDSLAGNNGEVRDIAELMESLREQMQEHIVDFKLRALPKKKWSDLHAQHKPRQEDKDGGLDYNGETFPVAALAACCYDPAMTVEQAEQLVDTISQGQWDELYLGVFMLNRGRVDVPFSASASGILSATRRS
jgi:hypothetical protein